MAVNESVGRVRNIISKHNKFMINDIFKYLYELGEYLYV